MFLSRPASPVLPHPCCLFVLVLVLVQFFLTLSICVSIWSVKQISFNCEITLSLTADQFLFQGTIKAYLILLSKPMPVPALPHARPSSSLYQHIFTVFFLTVISVLVLMTVLICVAIAGDSRLCRRLQC